MQSCDTTPRRALHTFDTCLQPPFSEEADWPKSEHGIYVDKNDNV